MAFRLTQPHAGMPIRHPVRNARTARVWSSGKESRLETQMCRFTGAVRARGWSGEVSPAGVLKHWSVRGQRQQEELAPRQEEQAGREEDSQQRAVSGLT